MDKRYERVGELFDLKNPNKLLDCSVPLACDYDDALALYGLSSQGYYGDIWQPWPTGLFDIIPKA